MLKIVNYFIYHGESWIEASVPPTIRDIAAGLLSWFPHVPGCGKSSTVSLLGLVQQT